MDVFVHAAAGASTGLVFGRPVLGALIAAAPDLMLIGKRKEFPPKFYDFTHSMIFIALCVGLAIPFDLHWLVYFCLASHILLDIPTHGARWAPPLLWPFSLGRFNSQTEEWEFFNAVWTDGAIIALLWSILWVSVYILSK